MKNANGQGTIRKKVVNGRTYWEGRIYIDGTRKSVSAKTQKECLEKMLKAASGGYIPDSKLTVGSWLDTWLKDFCADKKQSTVALYQANIRIHVKPALGKIPLAKLSRKDVQKFINGLQLAPATVDSIHGMLSGALSKAVDLEIIPQNPCQKITLPRKDVQEKTPLTAEQIQTVLNGEAPLFKFLLLTGLRISEALGLTWDCVNGDSIRIEKQYHNGTFSTPKSNRPRMISPAPAVFDLLKARKAEAIEQRFHAGIYWEGPKDFEQTTVFADELGKPLCYATVQQRFKKFCPDATLHSLRHTFAVLSLQNGDDPKTVQAALGHHSAAFTLDTYGHVSDEMRKASAARMQAFIESVIS